jgi:TetR/AcrR family transcriptional repressor of lmrAB and yxaGH operons
MLEAAIDLMRGYGLSGAGINDVVRESGSPKGSVYHFFPGGKGQVVAEALDIYVPRMEAFIGEALSTRTSAPDKVKALFSAFAARAEEAGYMRSCPVGAVSLDLGDEDEPLRLLLAAALESWSAVIASHLPLDGPARAKSFAGLLLTAVEGAYVRARAERSNRAFRDAGAWLSKLVE